jgi:hypothetical protein
VAFRDDFDRAALISESCNQPSSGQIKRKDFYFHSSKLVYCQSFKKGVLFKNSESLK